MNITQIDIDLVRDLETRVYNKTMNGVVTIEKQNEFKELKSRLETLSLNYKAKYDFAGPFETETAKGNPISYHNQLRRVWSGMFKGAENKQYAAQISFVINTADNCLDVGFYFGRASSINMEKALRRRRELELRELGRLLSVELNANEELQYIFRSLFEYGFKAEVRGHGSPPTNGSKI